MIFVSCPWKAKHNIESGITETAVFVMPGDFGFECRHDHCADKQISNGPIIGVPSKAGCWTKRQKTCPTPRRTNNKVNPETLWRELRYSLLDRNTKVT